MDINFARLEENGIRYMDKTIKIIWGMNAHKIKKENWSNTATYGTRHFNKLKTFKKL